MRSSLVTAFATVTVVLVLSGCADATRDSSSERSGVVNTGGASSREDSRELARQACEAFDEQFYAARAGEQPTLAEQRAAGAAAHVKAKPLIAEAAGTDSSWADLNMLIFSWTPTELFGDKAKTAAYTAECARTGFQAKQTADSAPGSADEPATDGNREACQEMKATIESRNAIFAGLAAGTSSPGEAADAALTIHGALVPLVNKANGEVSTQLMALMDGYGQMAMGLTNYSPTELSSGIATRDAAVSSLQKLCGSI